MCEKPEQEQEVCNEAFLKQFFNILPRPENMVIPSLAFDSAYQNVAFHPSTINNLPELDASTTFPVRAKFSASKDLPVPGIPFVLMDTSFETNSPLQNLVDDISRFLKDYQGVSFEFMEASSEVSCLPH